MGTTNNNTYENVSVGFQRAISVAKERESEKLQKKIPVVGYTGHRMGYKALGFFGKNYRDCSI